MKPIKPGNPNSRYTFGPMPPTARPAIFLDRDGVIIENVPDYVRKPEDIRFLARTFEALRKVAHRDFAVVVVTNQSGVGRGLITLCEAENLNESVMRKIREEGGRIDKAYLCPHAPDAGCECRKPKPGMLKPKELVSYWRCDHGYASR
jgi:histidinol-phosphate phosphatase family protein